MQPCVKKMQNWVSAVCSRPEVIKLFSCSTQLCLKFQMLISVNTCMSRNSDFFLGLDKPRLLLFLLIDVKMPTIVGIFTFMSRKSFILSFVVHEKKYYNLGARSIFPILNTFTVIRLITLGNKIYKTIPIA